MAKAKRPGTPAIAARPVFGTFAAVLLGAAGAGCATTATFRPHRHPDFEARYRPAKVVGLVEPQVKIFELAAGGTRELKPAWSDEGKKAVGDALAEELRRRGFEVKGVQVPSEAEETLRDVRLLYEAVQEAILQATRGGQFPAKVQRFEYSLGPLGDLADRGGVEAFAFAYGYDEISSSGRAALGVLGVLSAAILGVGAVPRGGVSVVSIAIVDRSGEVLWFHADATRSRYDLRKPESAAVMVASVMRGLPGRESRGSGQSGGLGETGASGETGGPGKTGGSEESGGSR